MDCSACGSQGWWCRGCGGAEKREALQKYGFSEKTADAIYRRQFGCCSLRVPCYVCNRDGLTVPGQEGEDPTFWDAFVLPESETEEE